MISVPNISTFKITDNLMNLPFESSMKFALDLDFEKTFEKV